MKNLIYIFLISFPIFVTGQDAFVENFNSDSLSLEWRFPHETYSGQLQNGILKVDYNRTSNSWIWDQFNIQLETPILIEENPSLRIKVRSNEKINLVLKPENTSGGSDWLEESLNGDGEWHEIFYQLSNSQVLPIKAMYFYFDPGSTSEKSAVVEFDEIAFGGDINIPLNFDLLNQSISDASNLLSNLTIGIEDGNNTQEDWDYLESSIKTYQQFLLDFNAIENQTEIDSLAYSLYDICTDVERRTFFKTSIDAVDDSMVYSSKILLENLHKMKGPRFMYGMHDPTGYGVNWSGDDDRSDVKDVTGSYPAFFSWDANEIVGSQLNERLSYRVKNSHDLGVVTSFCWHQYDPTGTSFYSNEVENASQIGNSLLPGNENNSLYKDKLKNMANYAKSTRGSNGRSIPIVFRPYHEHNGWWFWWGSSMPEKDYIDLWQYTVDYLKDSLDVHNLVYAFSPDGGQITTLKPYTFRYPGDAYVDVLGLDYYFDSGTDLEIDRFLNYVESAVILADSLNKVAAVTEIGDRNALEINKWHTSSVLHPLKSSELTLKVAYVSTWRNADEDHHFAPYPGHKSVNDFLEFYSDSTTVFLNNLVKGVSDSLYTSKISEKSDAAFLFDYKIKNGPQFSIDNVDVSYDGPLIFNYTSAVPVFEYSQLATIEIAGVEQISDSTIVNLSLPTTYTIVSENEEVSRDYEVIINELLTSVDDIDVKNDIELDIYPLPARDYLNINSDHLIKSIKLNSSLGEALHLYENVNANRFQLTQLQSGLLVINIEFMNGKSVTRKIIIH